jgi:hypothetical protein
MAAASRPHGGQGRDGGKQDGEDGAHRPILTGLAVAVSGFRRPDGSRPGHGAGARLLAEHRDPRPTAITGLM